MIAAIPALHGAALWGLQVREVLLLRAPWGDGRSTAGQQSAQAKNNEQLPEASGQSQAAQAIVLLKQRLKLPAGDLVLYPGTSVHRVEPVTRGLRFGANFWVQSMVRSDKQRLLLFEMDRHLMSLRSRFGETDPAVVGLAGTYQNLLRAWIDV